MKPHLLRSGLGVFAAQAVMSVMVQRRAMPPWDVIVESTPAFVGEPEDVKADSAAVPLFTTADMERA